MDLDKLRRDLQHTVGYFEGLDTEIISMIQKLRGFQQMYPRLKFHMFMETDMDSMHCPGKTFRVLYSPTIVLTDDKHKTLVHQVTSSLSLLSSLSASNNTVPVISTEEPSSITPKSIFNISTLPTWYPGCIENGLDDRPLILDEGMANRFESLPPAHVARMYEVFFQEAFDCIKRNCRSRLKAAKVKVYESFTAPWYKRIIKVGFRTNTAESRVIQNKRQLRQQLGRQRMAWTLACFYQFEAAFSRAPLDYLVKTAGVLPSRENTSTRMIRPTGEQKDAIMGATTDAPAELGSSSGVNGGDGTT